MQAFWPNHVSAYSNVFFLGTCAVCLLGLSGPPCETLRLFETHGKLVQRPFKTDMLQLCERRPSRPPCREPKVEQTPNLRPGHGLILFQVRGLQRKLRLNALPLPAKNASGRPGIRACPMGRANETPRVLRERYADLEMNLAGNGRGVVTSVRNQSLDRTAIYSARKPIRCQEKKRME